MTTVTVLPNQGMLDVIVQATGSLESGMQFCWDNQVSISDTPVVGTTYLISDAATTIAKIADGGAGLQYLVKNSIIVGTLNAPLPSTPLLNDDGSPLLNDDSTPLYNDNN